MVIGTPNPRNQSRKLGRGLLLRKILLLGGLLLPLFMAPSVAPQIKKSPRDLPPQYRRWLEEEVIYIISPKERDVFLQLGLDRERDIFIEAFWKQRDLNPNTLENEFKKEHYRRIDYANQWFGRDSPGPGWKTDMGRIYIILGEPHSIERYESLTDVYPTIIWFYQGQVEYGLPNAFSIVFFKKNGIGEYELYSPIKFGPQYLIINYNGDMTDYQSAFSELLKTEPNIARVSLSLIEGETSTFVPTPSIASEVLLSAKIPAAPYEKVKDEYAEKLLRYKDIIEVDYTANYIESDFLLQTARDNLGISFVHYLIEPKRLSVEQFGQKFQTILEINGRVSDLEGKMIFQFDRTVPIELDQGQMDRIQSKLFSFQDIFPLVEGHYKFTALLKNRVSKEFTSVEQDLVVPVAEQMQMGPLLLANRVLKNPDDKSREKAFLIGGIQFVPSPRNDFSREDTLYLTFQVTPLDQELRESGLLEYSILKEDSAGSEKVLSFTKNIKEYGDSIDFYEEIALKDLAPSHYLIRVALLNENRAEVLARESHFYISQYASIPRPWVLSLPGPPSDDPLYINILGNQLLNKKAIPEARALLESAYRKSPNSPEFALDFGRVLFLAKDYQGAKNVALPFYQNQGKNEFLGLLGQSCQALREYEEAVFYYKAYLSHFGTNINILNSIGECYYQTGNIEEALVAWEKSLEINPKQENIKKLVDSLKLKK
jgi:GWxTD domain-containing protein